MGWWWWMCVMDVGWARAGQLWYGMRGALSPLWAGRPSPFFLFFHLLPYVSSSRIGRGRSPLLATLSPKSTKNYHVLRFSPCVHCALFRCACASSMFIIPPQFLTCPFNHFCRCRCFVTVMSHFLGMGECFYRLSHPLSCMLCL